MIINFYKCVANLSYQNCVDLINNLKQVPKQSQSVFLNSFDSATWSRTRTRTSTEVLYVRLLLVLLNQGFGHSAQYMLLCVLYHYLFLAAFLALSFCIFNNFVLKTLFFLNCPRQLLTIIPLHQAWILMPDFSLFISCSFAFLNLSFSSFTFATNFSVSAHNWVWDLSFSRPSALFSITLSSSCLLFSVSSFKEYLHIIICNHIQTSTYRVIEEKFYMGDF